MTQDPPRHKGDFQGPSLRLLPVKTTPSKPSGKSAVCSRGQQVLASPISPQQASPPVYEPQLPSFLFSRMGK